MDSVAVVKDEVETLSTDEVCAVTGVTFRMLDYWTRRGIVTPDRPATGTGSHRRWGPRSVAEVRVIGALRTLGVPLDRICVLLNTLRARPGVTLVVTPNETRISSDDPARILDVVRGSGGAALVLSLPTDD